MRAQRAPVTFLCLLANLVQALAVFFQLALTGRLTDPANRGSILPVLPFAIAAVVLQASPRASKVCGCVGGRAMVVAHASLLLHGAGGSAPATQ